jgi:hypothetical protein
LGASVLTGKLEVGFMAHDKLLKEKRGAVMDMGAATIYQYQKNLEYE